MTTTQAAAVACPQRALKTPCLGPRCAMWRWAPCAGVRLERHAVGYCGAAGVPSVDAGPDGRRLVPQDFGDPMQQPPYVGMFETTP